MFVGVPVRRGGLVHALAGGQAMPGDRLRPLADLVAEPQRPLADHRLFGVVVVVERCRRSPSLGGDVGDGGGQDALAGDDDPGGGVDGGLRLAAALRR